MTLISDPQSSVLQYGPVSLPFVKTNKFSQEAVYSADGVDVLYTKITIGVDSVLTYCLLGEEPAAWIRRNQGTLMQRGLQLTFVMDGKYVFPSSDNPLSDGGEELLASPNYDYLDPSFEKTFLTDAKIGPKPIRFDTRAINGGAMLVSYEIETYIPYCDGNSGTPALFLSNRWEVSVDVDDEYFMSRTINGLLVLNGQWTNADSDIQSPAGLAIDIMVRDQIIIPPGPNRWKRDTMKFNRSSDGLTVAYTIVDKQLYAAMPRPATKIDATYTESTGGKDSGLLNMTICEMQVTVWGEPFGGAAGYDPTNPNQPDYNKYNLIKLMFQIVFSRIKNPFTIEQGTEFGAKNLEMIQYFQMKEDLFKPMVGCTVRSLKVRDFVTNPIGKQIKWDLTNVFDLTAIGQPIPLNDIVADIGRQPSTIGNYGLFLITSNALGSGNIPLGPCSPDDYRSIGSSIVGSAFYPGNTQANLTKIYATSTNIGTTYYTQTASTYYGCENYKHPFTEYQIDTQYLTDQHMLQLPVMYDVAPTAQSSVFGQTAAPTTRKIINWKASRLGQWPMSPNPNNATITQASPPTEDKLLSYHITMADSQLLSDGITRRYQTAGIYEVGCATRLQWDVAGGTIPASVNPITTDIWGDRFSTYPNSLFVPGILGYSTLPPGGTQLCSS